MKKQLCVLGLVLVSGVAHADKPSWCPASVGNLKGIARDAKPEFETERRLGGVVQGKCGRTSAEEKPVVDAAYEELSKALDMTEADWVDVLDFEGKPRSNEVRNADGKVAWTARGPVDQYATFQRPWMEVPGLTAELDIWYLADLYGPQLSQLGHLAVAQKCLAAQDAPVVWAMCQTDLDALDFKKIAEEIRADKTHDGFGRTLIRLAAADVKAALPGHAEDIKKLEATDDAYKQLFALGKRERAEWASRYSDDKELIDLARQMDEAFVTSSRKASAGCKPKAWEHLTKAISKIPAKEFTSHRKKEEPEDVLYGGSALETMLIAIISDPEGYLAAETYASCIKLEDDKQDPLGELLEAKANRNIGFRGPRTGTESRIALADLKFDRKDTRLNLPQIQRFWWIGNASAGIGIGTVASVKAKGDSATVAFQQKLEKAYYDTGCKQGRLQGWRSDGSPNYELNCAGTKVEMIDRRAPPQTVEARFVTGIKPGMQVAYTEHMVILAWPKPESGTPSIVLGAPVK